MGLSWSTPSPEDGIIPSNEIPETGPDIESIENSSEALTSEETEDQRKIRKDEELIKFKNELAVKRDLRKKKLNQVSDELKGLRDQLQEEVTKRKELEKQLSKYTGDPQEFDTSSKISTVDVESLRISRYDEDDDDEIDILDDEEDGLEKQMINDEEQKKKKKAFKKKVSFSLDLVTEHDENDKRIDENKQSDEDECKVENNDEIDEATNDDDKKNDHDENDVEQLKIQNKKLENQVKALKDVANLSKQLLGIREAQVEELNDKLAKVEDKEKDYDRKMTAMKELRRLYEERGRAMLLEHKHQLETERTRVSVLKSKLRFSEDTNEDLTEKTKHLQEKVKNFENQLDDVRNQLSETKIKLATEKESLYHASSQISLINNLVSQIISGPELDLDHLARFLEDNHALINELTAKGEIDYVASALVGVAGGIIEMPKEEKSDIAENLGKVWRLLVELLSHHKKSESGNQEWESCYKSVDTPKGPKLVISVSQTFIKLKDLILEKNSLVKEVGRLKKLNHHLEYRMEEQENRLTLVTEELHNTWDVVNKLKRQHDNLHTHEKILKHELQHKRSMLNGLKKQLETCREQWTLAREKNSKTENDWMLLRAEFASRKKKKIYNSAESGYEEEEVQSPEYDTDDDKSLEIEEESPDNSVGENMLNTGSVSPSETTSESNSIMDECNGPISEILDGIFDEAYKIVKTKNDNKIEPSGEIQLKNEEINTDEQESINYSTNDEYEVQNKYSTVCDVTFKRLEQIPEEDDTTDHLNIETNSKTVSLSDILKDETTEDKSEINEVDHNKNSTEDTQLSSNDNESIKCDTGNLTTDEILKRRDERLKRMEESCKSLFVKMGQTSYRSVEISNKLDQIHATYGPQSTSSETCDNTDDDTQQNVIDNERQDN